MIKAKLGNIRILGLSEENLKRLREDDPIMFDNAWEDEPGSTIIMYGETEQEITDKLGKVAKIPTPPDKDKH